MSSALSLTPYAIVFVLVQVLAALPWILTLNLEPLQTWWQRTDPGRRAFVLLGGVAGVVVAGVLAGLFLAIIQDHESLERIGRVYASVLHLQLLVDGIVFVFLALLFVWPKGAAVALAAFREGVRQPLYWLIFLSFVAFMFLLAFVPFFTFGQDFVMMKELDYDLIMLAAVLFGTLAASLSIGEEIEGRTAVTLMSKPVSRRQFLLGKFTGIFLAALLLTGLLGWWFEWTQLFKRWLERMDPVPVPPALTAFVQTWAPVPEAADLLRGMGWWTLGVWSSLPGLVLGFCQVMVLLALAVALATRLPLIINLVICLLVFFLAHMTPVLKQAAAAREQADPTGAPVGQMLGFIARLFDAVLPSMPYFTISSVLLRDVPPPVREFNLYVGEVFLYAVLYTTLVLLFGLILFEDRDLA